MASDVETVEKFVHRANIAKYQRILRTYLTDEERRFVERRLKEEINDLRESSGSILFPDNQIYAA
jgi:hypothetical protein